MKPMKRIFVLVYEVANAELGLMLAGEAQRRDFDVVMWSPFFLPNTWDVAARAIANRSVYIHETTALGSLADIWTPVSGWLSGKPARLPRGDTPGWSGSGWREALSELKCLRAAAAEAFEQEIRRMADVCTRRVAFCEDMLVRLGIDALVLPDDNVERDSFAWIAAARRRGIPANVVSYGGLSPLHAEIAYKNSPIHRLTSAEADILRRHLPHWLREGEGYSISRLPLPQLLAREMAGYSVANPWLINTGFLDMIGLESESARLLYRAHGFNAGTLHVTGHPFHDRLHAIASRREQARAELAARLGIDPYQPWLLTAMPPNQTDHRPVADGADFETLISNFCLLPEQVSGWQVLTSPHPNIMGADRDRLQAIASHVIEGPVADVLPLADAYLACVSTTIKWALALGLPVIDFDCFGYGYQDYLEEPGVQMVSNRNELESALATLAQPLAFAQWQDRSRNRADHWGRIDGHAMDRIFSSIFGTSDRGGPRTP
jgi:hypothetical protein